MAVSEALKNLGIRHNVCINVIDRATHKVVRSHVGHNAATNTLLVGIGHFLKGDGVLNQSDYMLTNYVPRYISLGTMGLYNQEEDENGYPSGVGLGPGEEVNRFQDYMKQCPGFGADGYEPSYNNGRPYLGLGPKFDDRADKTHTVNCELISKRIQRSEISYRDVVPEKEAEVPKTIDVIFSALVSTGALAEFREPGKNHLFITEAGLWTDKTWSGGANNGLLAGYRIAPTDRNNWSMETQAQRDILKREIIRVDKNQIVQIVWKIQLGAVEELVGLQEMDPYGTNDILRWENWT